MSATLDTTTSGQMSATSTAAATATAAPTGPPSSSTTVTGMLPYLAIVWAALVIVAGCCVFAGFQTRARRRRRRAALEQRIAELRARIAVLEAEERARERNEEDKVPITEAQIKAIFAPVRWGDKDKRSLAPGWICKGGEIVPSGDSTDSGALRPIRTESNSTGGVGLGTVRRPRTLEAVEGTPASLVPLSPAAALTPPFALPVASTPLFLPATSAPTDLPIPRPGSTDPELHAAQSTLRRLLRTPKRTAQSSPFLSPQPFLRPSQMLLGSPQPEWTSPGPAASPAWLASEGLELPSLPPAALPDAFLPLPESVTRATTPATPSRRGASPPRPQPVYRASSGTPHAFSPRSLFGLHTSPALQPHSPIFPVPGTPNPNVKSPGAFSFLSFASRTETTCLVCMEKDLRSKSEVLRLPCGHGQWCYPCGLGWIGVCCNGIPPDPAVEGEQGSADGESENRGETAQPQPAPAQSRPRTLKRVKKTIVCPLCRAEVSVPFDVEIAEPPESAPGEVVEPEPEAG